MHFLNAPQCWNRAPFHREQIRKKLFVKLLPSSKVPESWQKTRKRQFTKYRCPQHKAIVKNKNPHTCSTDVFFFFCIVVCTIPLSCTRYIMALPRKKRNKNTLTLKHLVTARKLQYIPHSAVGTSSAGRKVWKDQGISKAGSHHCYYKVCDRRRKPTFWLA